MAIVKKAWKDVQPGDRSLEHDLVVLWVDRRPSDEQRVWVMYTDGTLAKPYADSVTQVEEDYIAPDGATQG